MQTSGYVATTPVGRRVRAYFAPVARATQTPVLFDPASEGAFALDSPPAPWIDMGFISSFQRKSSSKMIAVQAGNPASTLCQTRESVDAQVSFEFLGWTKLNMALATGSQHMNLLATPTGSTAAADGGQATSASALQSGSTSTLLMLASTDAAKYSAGMMIAVDVDYSGQTGYVGSPISGAYLRSALTDADYVRRVTFNVALVASVSATSLTLAQALPGGAPAASAKLQQVVGFVDREGGTFCQEWSALFVVEGSQGERILFHYPRLQSMAGAEEVLSPLQSKQKGVLERVLLKGQFRALAVSDAIDGEHVVCYRSYLPSPNSLV